MNGTITKKIRMSGSISGGNRATGNIGPVKVVHVTPDRYAGPFSITPTDKTQVVEAGEKYLPENIIIEPIPSNYGKITWDGYTLTVS